LYPLLLSLGLKNSKTKNTVSLFPKRKTLRAKSATWTPKTTHATNQHGGEHLPGLVIALGSINTDTAQRHINARPKTTHAANQRTAHQSLEPLANIYQA
jgi:hypothetical protein